MTPCTKTKFESKKAAQKRISEIRAGEDVRDVRPKRAYYCYKCEAWHLTSQTTEYRERRQENRINAIANDWMKKKGWIST